MSSVSQPSTPNRPIQAIECPGAPARVKSTLKISIPEGLGRALIFPDVAANGAEAPRASDAPWAPKKARFTGNFTGPEMTPMNIKF